MTGLCKSCADLIFEQEFEFEQIFEFLLKKCKHHRIHSIDIEATASKIFAPLTITPVGSCLSCSGFVSSLLL